MEMHSWTKACLVGKGNKYNNNDNIQLKDFDNPKAKNEDKAQTQLTLH